MGFNFYKSVSKCRLNQEEYVSQIFLSFKFFKTRLIFALLFSQIMIMNLKQRKIKIKLVLTFSN